MKIYININNKIKQIKFTNDMSLLNESTNTIYIFVNHTTNIKEIIYLKAPSKPFMNIDNFTLYGVYALLPYLFEKLNLFTENIFTLTFHHKNELISLKFNKIFANIYSQNYFYITYNITFIFSCIEHTAYMFNKYITFNIKNDSLIEISNIIITQLLKKINYCKQLLHN